MVCNQAGRASNRGRTSRRATRRTSLASRSRCRSPRECVNRAEDGARRRCLGQTASRRSTRGRACNSSGHHLRGIGTIPSVTSQHHAGYRAGRWMASMYRRSWNKARLARSATASACTGPRTPPTSLYSGPSACALQVAAVRQKPVPVSPINPPVGAPLASTDSNRPVEG